MHAHSCKLILIIYFLLYRLIMLFSPSPFKHAHPAYSKVNFGSADSSQIDHIFKTFKILKQSPAYSAAMAPNSGLDMTDLGTVGLIVMVVVAGRKVFYQCRGSSTHACGDGGSLTLLFSLLVLFLPLLFLLFFLYLIQFYGLASI